MKIIKVLKRFLKDRNIRFLYLAELGIFNHMSDEEYLKKKFNAVMGYELDLSNPCTFNEKLQWLKLYNRKKEYSTLVDKYKVREHIAEILGEEYLIPLLGVWDREDEINFDTLPEQFVLKCNHNSGIGLCVCRDKKTIDIQKVRTELKKGLKQNFYLAGREWPYKNVERKIIAEKYMSNNSEDVFELTDYKFFCFDGYVDNVMVCTERATGETKFYFFNSKWELLRINKRGKEAPDGFTLPKPKCINEMFEITSKLSKGIPFVRIDLYECNEKIYFGEYTFYPDSGFDPNLLPETDKYLGELIDLESIKREGKLR